MHKGSVAAEKKEEGLKNKLDEMENNLKEIEDRLKSMKSERALEKLGVNIWSYRTVILLTNKIFMSKKKESKDNAKKEREL